MTRPTPETLAHSARRARSGTGAAGDSDSAARPGRAAPAAATTETPVREPATAQVSGAGSLVRSLEALGVDVVFGIPGG
ncbi:acetolactate synthase large subunit, partial [Micromonospora chalcea]